MKGKTMGKRISIFLCTVLMFMLLVVAKPQGVGAQKTGGQGKGDCYGVDIFTDAATENITKKVDETKKAKATKVSVGTTKITKVKIKKRTAKIKLKAVKNVTGYTVMVSTNSRFTKKKTKAINTTKINCSIKKLKKSKKYYIKARAFVEQKNVRYYGSWSTTKKVK